MDKRVGVKMNGGRYVHGILRGYDPFMNIVIDRTTEEFKEGTDTTHNSIGMVVCIIFLYLTNVIN